jgi:hypothetical protein
MEGIPSPASSGPPGGGGIKPEPSKKMGDHDFDKESDLTNGLDPEKSESGPSKSERISGKAKNAIADASETAQDIKDIATAGPTGLESSGKEVKQGYEKNGVKGAAGAATREAAGAAAEAAVDVLSAGALAEIGGKIQKGVSKALKKENLKKIGIAFLGFLLAPIVIGLLIITAIIYYIKNPWKLGWKILTDPGIRRVAIGAAKAFVGKAVDIINPLSSDEFYKKYGYVEYKPGTALAAPSVTVTPRPGSLEEKFTKIDFKKASYQSKVGPGCGYTIRYKEMVNPATNSKINIIDKVVDGSNKEIDKNSFIAQYCVFNSMPLYNMMIRTQQARDSNKYYGLNLTYGDAKNSSNFKGKDGKEINKYVYDKTIDKVTSPKDSNPKVKVKDIQQYIDETRTRLENGQDPNSVNVPWDQLYNANAPTESNLKTLCTFTQAYLSEENDNLRKGIYSRLNTSQRSGGKTGILSSTTELNQMDDREVAPTYKVMENWNTSVIYYQNVYGSQDGEKVDPERYANATYGANYDDTLALLLNLKDQCETYTDTGVFAGIVDFFTNSKQDAAVVINKDYSSLQKIVAEQSNGVFDSPDKVGMQQLLTGVITMGGGTAVSGVERSAQNYANQAQGVNTLNNQYSMRMGGRFLSNEESAKLNTLAESTRRRVEKQSGIAYRLFSEDNTRSLLNIVKAESPRTPKEISTRTQIAMSQIANPIKLIADLSSRINYIAMGDMNIAYAADKSDNAYLKLDTVGVPEKDFEGLDVFANSNEIQDIQEKGSDDQKKALGYFDKCAKANVPSKNVFARSYKVNTNNRAAVINREDPDKEDLEGVKIPKYPVVKDTNNIGFSDKKELIACEIYLLPENPATKRDLLPIQQQLFGLDLNSLARKYRVYLYTNSIADLMVQLSNTEKTDSIYANSGSGSNNSAPPTGNAGDNEPCPTGTTFQQKGIDKDRSGNVVRTFNVCIINGTSINVSVTIAAKVRALIDKANSQNVKLNGSSYRSIDRQIELRIQNCGGNTPYNIYEKPSGQCRPETAIPGNSMHEKGEAIDFTQGGTVLQRGGSGFNWLKANAAEFGLKNLPSEAWHWSTTGT